ncbi:MAG: heavy-metal-associated domain-containing protein [Nodosilinea sp. LVE1205-7]|jgi:copper chaperone
MTTLRLIIPDMACGACVDTITKTLQDLDPIAKVATDLKTKQVEIQTTLEQTLIIEAIQKVGYTVHL